MTKDNGIEQRFAANLDRARALVDAHDGLVDASGIPSAVAVDFLRAAVVLLHASMEDVLRSLEGLRLPGCTADVFRDFAFVLPSDPRRRPQKITLVELLEYRGRTVDEVLGTTIREYLETTNYNNAAEVVTTLRRINLGSTAAELNAAELEALMRRRHWIAHRADRDLRSPPGAFQAQPLEAKLVARWRDAVAAVGYDVLGQLMAA